MWFLYGLAGLWQVTQLGSRGRTGHQKVGKGRLWRLSLTLELWKATEPIKWRPGYGGYHAPSTPESGSEHGSSHGLEPGPFPPVRESLSVTWGRSRGENRPLGPRSYLVSKGRLGARGTKMIHQPSIPFEVTGFALWWTQLLSSWVHTVTFVYN